MLAFGGSEVTHLVENIIGGQQHLRLDELDAAIAQQRGGVHHFLAGVRLGRGHHPADDGDALGFRGNPLHGRAIVRHKRGPLDQIARRIAADREFRKQNQAGASTPRLHGKLDDLGGVAREVPHRGVDLAQGNLHILSVEGQGVEGRGPKADRLHRSGVYTCIRMRRCDFSVG